MIDESIYSALEDAEDHHDDPTSDESAITRLVDLGRT